MSDESMHLIINLADRLFAARALGVEFKPACVMCGAELVAGMKYVERASEWEPVERRCSPAGSIPSADARTAPKRCDACNQPYGWDEPRCPWCAARAGEVVGAELDFLDGDAAQVLAGMIPGAKAWSQLQLSKAQPLPGQKVDSVVIRIEGEIQPEAGHPAYMRAQYATQAKALARALRDSLPGGTMDRLLVELLAARSSDLAIARAPREPIPPVDHDDLAIAELHKATDGPCFCSGFRCMSHLAQDELRRLRPKIVVLCGSTRFYEAFELANYEETRKGNIVLNIGWAPAAMRSDHDKIKASGGDVGLTPPEKIVADYLHMRKIDMCDEIFVLNVDGYVGASTSREIEYAEMCGKQIRWLVEP